MSKSIISAKDLKKIYQVGETQVNALDGLDVDIQNGSYYNYNI